MNIETNAIIPFDYAGQQVRTVTVKDEPWFVASDIATVLDYSEASAMTRHLDEDEKGLSNVQTLGGEQEVQIISESGLYSAVLRSRKPEAKAFKRWVTHEVLPSIRKRGGYLTPEATEQALYDPDFIIRLATSLKEERERTKQLTAKVNADKPKVLFADAVATSKTCILIGDLAKILKQNGVDIGQKRLFAWMRENGYLSKQRGANWNSPMQESMELGLFEIKETAITHSDGHVTISKTTKVTGKGQQYFINKFLGQAK